MRYWGETYKGRNDLWIYDGYAQVSCHLVLFEQQFCEM